MNNEIYSSLFYLSMSAYFDDCNLPGFAHWMVQQYHEEISHSLRIYKYIYDRDGSAAISGVKAPPTGPIAEPLAALEMVLKHEKEVSQQINGCIKLDRGKEEYMTEEFWHFFLKFRPS